MRNAVARADIRYTLLRGVGQERRQKSEFYEGTEWKLLSLSLHLHRKGKILFPRNRSPQQSALISSPAFNYKIQPSISFAPSAASSPPLSVYRVRLATPLPSQFFSIPLPRLFLTSVRRSTAGINIFRPVTRWAEGEGLEGDDNTHPCAKRKAA